MPTELTNFARKLGTLLLVMPIAGYAMLRLTEKVEQAWKSNNRIRKKLAMCVIFGFLAALAGWLR